ncbi:hypothetical protein E5D57_002302 [Metarhizium anisopliae]|nr:hypothetical protein E5D57_002302 [Metarhizium anisopliae]
MPWAIRLLEQPFHDQNTIITNDQLHDRIHRCHTLNPTGARASEELGVESESESLDQTIFNHRAASIYLSSFGPNRD